MADHQRSQRSPSDAPPPSLSTWLEGEVVAVVAGKVERC
jgi:hypothetical protein